MTSVFISYSRRDREFVERLHAALAAREYEVWVDWEDIPKSAEWFAEIRAGIGASDGFIYVISPDSIASHECSRELELAVEQNKRILPILRREPDGAKVPEAAAAINWLFLRDADDFDAGVQQLVAAVETDLEHVRIHTRLGVAADRWDASGRDASQLLRGSELNAAEAWLVAAAGKQPEATQLQREYLLAGRRAAMRRQRTVIGAVTVALAVAIALAVVALIQRSTAIHERNVARARQYDVEAQSLYSRDPELSVLLAVQAAKVAPSTATEQALREALAQSHVRATLKLASVRAGDALWSPDGRRLLATSPHAWSVILTPGTAASPVSLPGPSSLGQSGWDARGDRVVIGGGHPAVYDTSSGRLVRRLPGTAFAAALTGDGARAVTVDLSFTGHVFDVASGRQLAVFHPRYTGGVTCFALSPDGTVAAQCDAQSLQSLATPAALDLWDLRTGKLMHSLASSGVISSVGFNPDGRMFVFTSSGATTTRSTAALAQSEGKPGTFVYETHSGRLVISFPGAASAAAFGPSLEFPAVAYATVGDDLGHVYDFTSRVNHPLTGDTDVIESMRFNSAGTYVVTGSKDDTARVFDANTGGAAVEVLAGDTDRIRDAGFGLNGTSIATASEDGTTRLWASPTPRPSRTLPGSDAGAVTVAFTADSSRIVDVANPAEGAIRPGVGRILDARTLSVLARLRAPAGQSFAGAEPTRDGRFVATLSGRYDQRLRSVVPTAAESYDARTGRLLATVTATSPIAANLDYAGHTLATEGLDGNSNEWDLRTGRLLHHLPGTNIAVTGAFSRDGSQLAIAHYPTLPRSVGLSTTFGPVTIDVWDARTGRLRRRITGATLAPQEPGTTFYAPLNLAFSPDGRLLAFSGADPAVEVYDAHSVRLVATLAMSGLSGGSYAASLTFSPDGKLLAAGSASGTYLWRVPSLQSLDQFEQVSAGSSLPFVGAGFGVTAGFTADSRYLTTSGDSSVEAWDPADHLQLFKAFPAVQGALSPNATEFVTAGASGLALYPCDLCGGMKQLLALASRRTTRQLTASERASYLGQG